MTHRIATRLRAGTRVAEAGMTTAEYAVGTVAACGFAGILYKLLTSGFGQTLLQTLLDKVMDILPI